jgi:hypothetical protein
MRAARTSMLPRVLRVGVVQAGRVVNERTCDAFPVTIGSDETASLVVPALTTRHALFEKRGGAIELRLARGMTGRLLTEGGPVDVEGLVRAAEKAGRDARVTVTEAVRGRIDVAGARILFQFVERPIASAQPRLPLSVKNGNGIDWSLAMIAAMSFLFHFGFLGAMYSDWADPIVDDGYTVGALVDMKKQLADQRIEEPDPDPIKKEVAKKEDATPTKTTTPTTTSPTNPTHTTSHDAALMASRADGMMLGILTASNDKAPSTEAALKRTEIPTLDLKNPDGSMRPDSELTFRGSAPIRPGEYHDLSTIGNIQRTAQNDKHDQPRVVQVPTQVETSPVIPTVRITNADRVVAELRPKFRKCYTDGLGKDPSQQGSIVVRAKIAPTGEVAGVTIQSNTGLSADVASCIAKRVQNAQFDAPGGTGSTLDIPVKLVHQ